VVDFYRERGYYDAQIVRDSFYVDAEDGRPEVIVELEVREGAQYHIRNIEWEGNTVIPEDVLSASLGFSPGDVYNSQKLEQNLFMNRSSTDVASLYMNRGHMRFNVQPTIRVVEGDSLDIHLDVFEGDVYAFGTIDIAGNTKTKEHVVRRELYTVPGQTFSRESIQESMRRLSQLQYFDAESMAAGPGIEIDEGRKTVDLKYNLEEVGSDQLELSGTWGRFGLILMLRFGFNNFSAQNLFNKDAWKPLPSGDGQKLSVGLQTNGRYYQSYSLSFTEPWYRGRPTPVGFSLSHSRLGGGGYMGFGARSGSFTTSSVRTFYERRLKWPDDFFSASTSLGYQYYDNGRGEDRFYSFLPAGMSQEVTVQQSFSRSSLDNPMFPMRGSQMQFSVQVAPPVPGFIQYHKWRFKTDWNVPIAPKLTLAVGTDYGVIGSLTGRPVTFERFDVGGSPFETQGLYTFGSDIVYMRGYPRSAIGPRREDEAVGGTILNKYTSELRWLAIQSPQLQAAPYLFLDAANTWNDFRSYNPASLYRSAGMGVRLFLPIIGMLELTYGYNFDEFTPLSYLRSRHDGSNRWYFQFSLGQGF
jgi:outer membrane protein insertion porin family